MKTEFERTIPAVSIAIGGFIPFSAVDWPGRLAAVIFTQGCSWRCHYCHNPHLIPFSVQQDHSPPWPEIYEHLARRAGFLDAVVFSGGEPTLQPGLAEAVQAVKSLGYAVGLHTGAPSLKRFADVLPMVNWVGFDFKAPFNRYHSVTQKTSGMETEASMRALLESGKAHEIRTTWHPDLLNAESLEQMADFLCALGVTSWQIQRFRPTGCQSIQLRPLGSEQPEFSHRTKAKLEIFIR